MEKLLELEEKLRKAKADLEKQGLAGLFGLGGTQTSGQAGGVSQGSAGAGSGASIASQIGFGKKDDEENEIEKACEMIKFDSNGQWSMEKGGETSDNAQRTAPGARQPAYVRGVFGEKAKTAKVVDSVITPEQQVQAKKDLATKNKAKFEAEAKARREEYRKEGTLKSEDDMEKAAPKGVSEDKYVSCKEKVKAKDMADGKKDVNEYAVCAASLQGKTKK